jgi:hypothetical protein
LGFVLFVLFVLLVYPEGEVRCTPIWLIVAFAMGFALDVHITAMRGVWVPILTEGLG